MVRCLQRQLVATEEDEAIASQVGVMPSSTTRGRVPENTRLKHFLGIFIYTMMKLLFNFCDLKC